MKKQYVILQVFVLAVWGCLLACNAASSKPVRVKSSTVITLDGPDWLLGTDPKELGKEQKWWLKPIDTSKQVPVPGIIQDQDAFPEYHGVAWYWKDFVAPKNPHRGGRYLLKFWSVDYKADVWINDTYIGSHIVSEVAFEFDVTKAIKPGVRNRLAVRVVNPVDDHEIDGITLGKSVKRTKGTRPIPHTTWGEPNFGGIMDSVELMVTPAVRVSDVFVRTDYKTGVIRAQVEIANTAGSSVKASVQCSVSGASQGRVLDIRKVKQKFSLGKNTLELILKVNDWKLWQLNEPYLYRVTTSVTSDKNSDSIDEYSVRTGFRDFRFEDGYFKLNGKRTILRCSHTGGETPIGLMIPHDPDIDRKLILHMKEMGFNSVRFFCHSPRRRQLDLCDELGMMAYCEPYCWLLEDFPGVTDLMDISMTGLVLRNRNHPSVVMWGLLNEAGAWPTKAKGLGHIFDHAIEMLPLVRKLDDTRMVMLNSGRHDGRDEQKSDLDGLRSWKPKESPDVPCVTFNLTDRDLSSPYNLWKPGTISAHSGRGNGVSSVIRFKAPANGKYNIEASFNRPPSYRLFQDGREISEMIRQENNFQKIDQELQLKKGSLIDFACVSANDIETKISITAPNGKVCDLEKDITPKSNPFGNWQLGSMPIDGKGKPGKFKVYDHSNEFTSSGIIGSISNPDSMVWQNMLEDRHPYYGVPHTADTINTIRTLGRPEKPFFMSEYGIGSGLNLFRMMRLYEQAGKEKCLDALGYQKRLEWFLNDWNKWSLAETFGTPDYYLNQTLAEMAVQRLIGLNAIRSNPNIIGHSVSGTADQGNSGEGVITLFRELKPQSMDAMIDGWAPLRWCLFAEPIQVYSGDSIHLEAVIANEDILKTGVTYPAHVKVIDPRGRGVFEKKFEFKVPEKGEISDLPPLAFKVLDEQVKIQGPTGTYRVLASLEKGAAPYGQQYDFYVMNRDDMPAPKTEVLLWGADDGLISWLNNNGIKSKNYSADKIDVPRVILVGTKAPGGKEAFTELAGQIARGCGVIFLDPAVFNAGGNSLAMLPLVNKGKLSRLSLWLYHPDYWAKQHPFFEGLPTGVMDFQYYREIIPHRFNDAYSGQDSPAEIAAGAIDTSMAYSSALTLCVYPLSQGRFILNALGIKNNLGTNPVAERLLRNIINHTADSLNKTLSDLPDDFDQQIKSFGYID